MKRKCLAVGIILLFVGVVTADSLREGMAEKAQRLRISEEKVKKILTSNIHTNLFSRGSPKFIWNLRCEVSGGWLIGSVNLFLGLSLLTNNINYFIKNYNHYLRSVDFLDFGVAWGACLGQIMDCYLQIL